MQGIVLCEPLASHVFPYIGDQNELGTVAGSMDEPLAITAIVHSQRFFVHVPYAETEI